MASWSGIGSGSHALTAGTTHVFVVVNVVPPGVSVGNASPPNYYGVGLVRVGFLSQWRGAVPIDSLDWMIDIPADADNFAWNILSGGAVTFTEYPSGATPPPGGFVQDTFTAADGTALVDHTPDIGGAWGPVGSDMGITGGVATSVAESDSADFNLATPPDPANYTVAADIVCAYASPTSAMLWARQASGLTGYAVQLSSDGGIDLYRDYFTVLVTGTLTGFTVGVSYHVVLTVNGIDISVSVDGTTILTTTDTTYSTGDPGFGVRGGNPGAWTFDNFQATAL
jgi:hypothetical protein